MGISYFLVRHNCLFTTLGGSTDRRGPVFIKFFFTSTTTHSYSLSLLRRWHIFALPCLIYNISPPSPSMQQPSNLRTYFHTNSQKMHKKEKIFVDIIIFSTYNQQSSIIWGTAQALNRKQTQKDAFCWPLLQEQRRTSMQYCSVDP